MCEVHCYRTEIVRIFPKKSYSELTLGNNALSIDSLRYVTDTDVASVYTYENPGGPCVRPWMLRQHLQRCSNKFCAVQRSVLYVLTSAMSAFGSFERLLYTSFRQMIWGDICFEIYFRRTIVHCALPVQNVKHIEAKTDDVLTYSTDHCVDYVIHWVKGENIEIRCETIFSVDVVFIDACSVFDRLLCFRRTYGLCSNAQRDLAELQFQYSLSIENDVLAPLHKVLEVAFFHIHCLHLICVPTRRRLNVAVLMMTVCVCSLHVFTEVGLFADNNIV